MAVGEAGVGCSPASSCSAGPGAAARRSRIDGKPYATTKVCLFYRGAHTFSRKESAQPARDSGRKHKAWGEAQQNPRTIRKRNLA